MTELRRIEAEPAADIRLARAWMALARWSTSVLTSPAEHDEKDKYEE